jgi:GNAT superfamily N-acetyltransferase
MLHKELGSDVLIVRASEEDLPGILDLQKIAFQSEANIYGACAVPPLSQTIGDIRVEFQLKVFLKMLIDGRLVGSIRVARNEDVVRLEKLIVHPQAQGHGFGGKLIQAAEALFPEVRIYELMTGQNSARNIHIYQKRGYKIVRQEVKSGIIMVWLEKTR